jgi:hypothetical protein
MVAESVLVSRRLNEIAVAMSRLAAVTDQMNQERIEESARLRSAVEAQEKLIAMLWYQTYGLEPAENGGCVPSGRLTKVHGLRPTLKVGDPIFVGNRFYFV